MYYVYIMTNYYNTVFYIGVTNNIIKRVFEHKNRLVDGFTKKYDVSKLVFFDEVSDVESAILKEKQMKKWKREWKIRLIEKDNPSWDDLYPELIK